MRTSLSVLMNAATREARCCVRLSHRGMAQGWSFTDPSAKKKAKKKGGWYKLRTPSPAERLLCDACRHWHKTTPPSILAHLLPSLVSRRGSCWQSRKYCCYHRSILPQPAGGTWAAAYSAQGCPQLAQQLPRNTSRYLWAVVSGSQAKYDRAAMSANQQLRTGWC